MRACQLGETRPQATPLPPVDGEGQEGVAGLAAEGAVAGVGEEHAAGEDGAGPVEGAAADGFGVDGGVGAGGVEIPDDRAVCCVVRAEVAVERAREDHAGHGGDGGRLGGAAVGFVLWTADGLGGPDLFTGRELEGVEAAADGGAQGAAFEGDVGDGGVYFCSI